jgi:hypothetical protein
MTRKKSNRTLKEIKAMMGEDVNLVRSLVQQCDAGVFGSWRLRKPLERKDVTGEPHVSV